MDLSLTTDFESALLNWDVDEVHNAPGTSNHDHQHFNVDDGKQKNMISPNALAAMTTTTTSHDAATSLPSLPKQQELLQQLNYHHQLYQPQLQQQHTHNFNPTHPDGTGSVLGGSGMGATSSKRAALTTGLELAGTSSNNAISILDGNPIPQASYYHANPISTEATTALNNLAPNLFHNHGNNAVPQNNTNILLNGFVTTLDEKLPTTTLHQNNSQLTQLSNTPGSSSASSGATGNGQTIGAGKSSTPQQQLQQQQHTPQHLQVEGVTNPFWQLQDSSSNTRSGNNIGAATSTAPYMERIFPPNYFLPGMVSWDPSQAQPNSTSASSAKVPRVNMAVGGDPAVGLGEYGGERPKTDNSKSATTVSQSAANQSTILAQQEQPQQQQHHLNIGNTSVTPWGQQVPQHQILPQNGMQISQTNSIIARENIVNQPLLAAQNVQNSQMGSNNAIVDGSINCGTNNVSVHHQSMYHLNGGYGNSLPIGTSSTHTTNGISNIGTVSVPVSRDTGQQSQQISRSAPFQYITTNTNNDDSPSSSNVSNSSSSKSTLAQQKRKHQNLPPKSKTTKKARKNPSTTRKQKKKSVDTAPPFYLFDAPCELRTNFIQAQQLNNITVVQDNNAYHYGMAVNGFHPQLNAQANPPIQPTNTIHSSSGSSSNTSPEHVVLLDGRHKNKIRQGNERNEREQQRAQKITELIDKLRMTMVNGGWKKNEMKSKYQTLSTCAAYVKYLIQETKKKEAAIEKARSNLAIRNQKLEEVKSLQDSSSDPDSVTSSLTASSTFGTSGGQKGDEWGGMEECTTVLPSMRVISSSSGGSDDNNNSNSSDSKKNVSSSRSFFPEGQIEEKARVSTVGIDSQNSSTDGSVSVEESSNRKDGTRGSEWQNMSLHKRSSSMSEISDSTQSSKGGSGSDSGDGNTSSIDLTDSAKNTSSDDCETEDQSEASSISSTAAVMSGFGSNEQDNTHGNVIAKESIGDGKKIHDEREKTSLEVDFELNYQEVFLASNIPQLIATQTGRIAICNDFFHRATGMSEQDVQRITIFSIVQADKLSTLFELVATSLRRSNKPSSTDGCTTDTSAGPWPSSKNDAPYKTVTLPCIPFPKGMKFKSSKNGKDVLCPLFMTVTFMADDNPRNRCIHCILTEDGPGTESKTIIPKVLKKMFTKNELDVFKTKTPLGQRQDSNDGGVRRMIM